MNEESKKFYKKVFMYYGNDLKAWWVLDDAYDENILVREYVDNENISIEQELPEYFDLTYRNEKFTQKFLDEVLTW